MQLPIDKLRLQGGTVLYSAGERARAVFNVRTGLLKLVQYAPNGDQRIVRLLRPGDLAGLEALVDAPLEHTAVAMCASDVCRIPCEVVHKLIAATPRLLGQLMRRWHRSLHQADEWLTLLSTGNARARMARLMLLLQDGSAQPVCRLFCREDLAAILGITTETASRIVADFRRRHLIAPLAGGRLLLAPDALREIAQN